MTSLFSVHKRETDNDAHEQKKDPRDRAGAQHNAYTRQRQENQTRRLQRLPNGTSTAEEDYHPRITTQTEQQSQRTKSRLENKTRPVLLQRMHLLLEQLRISRR